MEASWRPRCCLLEIVLGDPPACDRPRLHKVLERRVVDALCRQDDVGARCKDLLDALARDVKLALADLLKLLGVRD